MLSELLATQEVMTLDSMQESEIYNQDYNEYGAGFDYYYEDVEEYNTSHGDTPGVYYYNGERFYPEQYDHTIISDSNNETLFFLEHPFSTGRKVALVIFLFICVIGLVGNMLVICTIARHVTMRKVTYLFLVNLSVADILYLIVCLPTEGTSYALDAWPFGTVFCKLERYVMAVSMCVNVWTLVVTGLDRYAAVMYPVKSRAIRTSKNAVVAICAVWTFSLVLMAPRINLYKEVDSFFTSPTKACGRAGDVEFLQLDTALMFVFMYVIPQSVLCICHFKIGQKLWNSTRPGSIPGTGTQLGILGVRERKRIAKIVFAITFVFAIGWLPLHVYNLAEDFYNKIPFGLFVDRGTVVLLFSFSANSMNPLIYCMFSSSFRKHFKKAFCCNKSSQITSIIPLDVDGREGWVVSPHVYRRPPQVLLPRPALLLPTEVSELLENFQERFPRSNPLSGPSAPEHEEPLIHSSDISTHLINVDTINQRDKPAGQTAGAKEQIICRSTDESLSSNTSRRKGNIRLKKLKTESLIALNRTAESETSFIAEGEERPSCLSFVSFHLGQNVDPSQCSLYDRHALVHKVSKQTRKDLTPASGFAFQVHAESKPPSESELGTYRLRTDRMMRRKQQSFSKTFSWPNENASGELQFESGDGSSEREFRPRRTDLPANLTIPITTIQQKTESYRNEKMSSLDRALSPIDMNEGTKSQRRSSSCRKTSDLPPVD